MVVGIVFMVPQSAVLWTSAATEANRPARNGLHVRAPYHPEWAVEPVRPRMLKNGPEFTPVPACRAWHEF